MDTEAHGFEVKHRPLTAGMVVGGCIPDWDHEGDSPTPPHPDSLLNLMVDFVVVQASVVRLAQCFADIGWTFIRAPWESIISTSSWTQGLSVNTAPGLPPRRIVMDAVLPGDRVAWAARVACRSSVTPVAFETEQRPVNEARCSICNCKERPTSTRKTGNG